VLNPEIFYTPREAQIIIERWRKEYNTFRPHSSLGYRPPAPEAFLKKFIVHNVPEMISSPKGTSTQMSLTSHAIHVLEAGQLSFFSFYNKYACVL
jgi:integrase-like protein